MCNILPLRWLAGIRNSRCVVIRFGGGIRDVRGCGHGVAGVFLGLEGGAGGLFGAGKG
jgi:hypothetical protein